MPRFRRPHVAPRARSLTLQTAQRARRAKWELMLLVPMFALILLAYLERERIFGVDRPIRLAAAVAMVILGWALARDLGRFTAPALFKRMDPGTAGTAGFLMRLAFVVIATIVALRVAGLNPATLAVGGAITAVVLGLATISSLLVVENSRYSPARTIDALSASRPFDSHNVLPLAASMAKNCPRFRVDSPKIVLPRTAGELMYIDTCSLRQTGVAEPFAMR